MVHKMNNLTCPIFKASNPILCEPKLFQLIKLQYPNSSKWLQKEQLQVHKWQFPLWLCLQWEIIPLWSIVKNDFLSKCLIHHFLSVQMTVVKLDGPTGIHRPISKRNEIKFKHQFEAKFKIFICRPNTKSIKYWNVNFGSFSRVYRGYTINYLQVTLEVSNNILTVESKYLNI